eukprot:gene26133-11853_t
MSLQWCAGRWYMGSVIIGATTVEQLKEDFDAFETPSLYEETLKAIDEIHLRRNPMHHDYIALLHGCSAKTLQDNQQSVWSIPIELRSQEARKAPEIETKVKSEENAFN